VFHLEVFDHRVLGLDPAGATISFCSPDCLHASRSLKGIMRCLLVARVHLVVLLFIAVLLLLLLLRIVIAPQKLFCISTLNSVLLY
jgi:hypothetical protein